MLKVLCEQLGAGATAIATLKTLYRSERMLREHREWARATLKFKVFGEDAEAQLRASLSIRAADAASDDELLGYCEEHLHESGIVLPGVRVLQDMARAAFQAVEELALTTVRAAVKPNRLRAILGAMFDEGPTPGASVLEWIKQSAGKHGVKGLEEVSSRIEYLKTLGAHEWELGALSPARIRTFALRVVHRPPAETSRRVIDTQTVEIICFLKHTLWELTEEAIFLASRRTSDLVRMGMKRVQARQALRTVEHRQSIQTIRELAVDGTLSAQQRPDAIVAMADEALGKAQVSHAEVVRETLTEQSARVRAILSSIECLELDGDAAKNDIRLVQGLKQLRADGAKELPPDFDISAVDALWRPLVEDADRVKALNAYQACTLAHIRTGLHGGRLWVSHSGGYRSRAELLIPLEEWSRDKGKICQALGLQTDAEHALRLQEALLAQGLANVETALQKGLIEIDEQGCVRIPKLRAAEEEPELRRTAQAVQEMIGPVQMPDLILDIDSKTRFSTALLVARPMTPQS